MTATTTTATQADTDAAAAEAYANCDGNLSAAARFLGCSPNTVKARIARHRARQNDDAAEQAETAEAIAGQDAAGEPETSGRIVAIVGPEYAATVRMLMDDPIITAMAYGLLNEAGGELLHPDGKPRHEFMMAALHEYNHRGGSVPTHIGGPAEAVLARVDEIRASQAATADADGGSAERVIELAQDHADQADGGSSERVAELAGDSDAPAVKAGKTQVTECVKCGFKFTKPQVRQTCQSDKACKRRQDAKAAA